MWMITQVLLVLTIVRGTFCQTIQFKNPRVITPCHTGARADVDRYTFSATAQGNLTHLLDNDWSPYILLMSLRPGSNIVETLCSLEFSSITCSGNPPECITCANNGSQMNMEVNLLLTSAQNGRILRMEWNQRPGRTVYSDKNFTLPDIFDVSVAALTLIIGGATRMNTHQLCQFSITVHTNNVFELCCSSSIRPCYAQITFRGVVVAKDGTPCVNYMPTANKTGVMKVSHALCSTSSYTMSSVCSVKREDGTLTDDGEVPTKSAITMITHADGVTAGVKSETTSTEVSEGSTTNSFEILVWVAMLITVLLVFIATIVLCMLQRKKPPKRKSTAKAIKLGETKTQQEERKSRASASLRVTEETVETKRSSVELSEHSSATSFM